MATYLLDTTALTLLMDENPGMMSRLDSLSSSDHLIICPIVRGEIRFGIEKLAQGKKRRDIETKVEQLFQSFLCEPISERAADHYGRVKAQTESKGTPVSENDLWIAATAFSLDAVLITKDEHFQCIEGLRVEDWSQ